MGPASKEREIMEDGEKADTRKGFAQGDVQLKQQYKVCE